MNPGPRRSLAHRALPLALAVGPCVAAACGERKAWPPASSPAPPSASPGDSASPDASGLGTPGNAPGAGSGGTGSAGAGGGDAETGGGTPYAAVCGSLNAASPDQRVRPTAWSVAAPGGGAKDTLPLRPGLTVVTAIATPDGDYESIKTVSGVSGDAISIVLNADVPRYDVMAHKDVPTPLESRRDVARADQDTTCGLAPVFRTLDAGAPPEHFPGTTGITFSSKLLAALKTGQDEYLRLMMPDFGGDLQEEGQWLVRVENRPIGVPVLLNDQRVVLAALHAECDSSISVMYSHDNKEVRYVSCEYLVLDDSANPVLLAWRRMDVKSPPESMHAQDGFYFVDGVLQLDTTQLQVVKIEYAPVLALGGSGSAAVGVAVAERAEAVPAGLAQEAPVPRRRATPANKSRRWSTPSPSTTRW